LSSSYNMLCVVWGLKVLYMRMHSSCIVLYRDRIPFHKRLVLLLLCLMHPRGGSEHFIIRQRWSRHVTMYIYIRMVYIYYVLYTINDRHTIVCRLSRKINVVLVYLIYSCGQNTVLVICWLFSEQIWLLVLKCQQLLR